MQHSITIYPPNSTGGLRNADHPTVAGGDDSIHRHGPKPHSIHREYNGKRSSERLSSPSSTVASARLSRGLGLRGGLGRLLLGPGLAPLAVGVGREAPEREHQRHALLAAELLVQEDDGGHLRDRDEHRDEDARQQRVHAEDDPNGAQEEELPQHRRPHEHRVVPGLPQLEVLRLPRDRLHARTTADLLRQNTRSRAGSDVQ
ncbi:hypothetical protein PVAP13_2NG364406 [Panicum virgatum]|uniref:Uncharacterized protein n=1 Tax=Panicum virgatum TaxID=38727 RepID=A0A8T0VST5_PANVG|nr:hypothetical protein PVAP13_2NG364406 [Panicum virgatum]